MVRIRNKNTGEIYKLYRASKEFTTKNSVMVDGLVGNVFRNNWKMVFDYFITFTSSTQCLLREGFEVI